MNAQAIGKRHFYTDSANDLPMLESVSHPVAVNPDPRLSEIAKRRASPAASQLAPAEHKQG